MRTTRLTAALQRPLILGVWTIPLSIAACEFLLSIAALERIVKLARRQASLSLPRPLLGLWLVWAGLEVVIWAFSPEPGLGWSEIRRLLLLAVLFFTMAGFDRYFDLQSAWKGVFVSSTAASLFVIGDFAVRYHRYQPELALGGAASFYLRTGGLHHWMVYGTIEIIVVAGLLSFWRFYPEARRWWWPAMAVHGAAIVLSLTRMVWLTCLLLGVVHLAWRRSRVIWALPLACLLLLGFGPDAVRARIAETVDLSFYSNAERFQMLEVGWKMVADHPLRGIGPGRVETAYSRYLEPHAPLPAFHGHLHNNVAQIAAQFGLPVLLSALLFCGWVVRDLLRARRAAESRDSRFVTETGLLAFGGFLFAGLFEYTYGHSLAVIMLVFAVLPALLERR